MLRSTKSFLDPEVTAVLMAEDGSAIGAVARLARLGLPIDAIPAVKVSEAKVAPKAPEPPMIVVAETRVPEAPKNAPGGQESFKNRKKRRRR